MGGIGRRQDPLAELKRSHRRLELRIALHTAEISEAQRLYADLYNNAADMLATIDCSGRLLNANRTLLALSGREPGDILLKQVTELHHPASRALIDDAIRRFLAGGRIRNLEVSLLGRDGAELPALLHASPTCDDQGRLLQGHLVWHDITDLRSAQGTVRSLLALIEHAGDAIISTDPDFRVRTWNPCAERMYGWSYAEVVGRRLGDVVPTEYVDVTEAEAIATLHAEGRWSGEVRQRSHGGEVLDLSTTVTLVRDEAGNVVGAAAVNRDIRAVKEAERLRARFVQQVMAAQDEERRRIGQDLHDDTASSLAIVALGLRTIEHLHDPAELRDHVRHLTEVVEKTQEDVSRLIQGLHPHVLEQLGFEAATRSYLDAYRRSHPIAIHAHFQGLEGDSLPSGVALALYRIVQEGLKNVARHSGATRAGIVADRRGDDICLTIDDDGVGLPEPEGTVGLGLQGIRERTHNLGGSFEIESTPGVGTALHVRIPVRATMKESSL